MELPQRIMVPVDLSTRSEQALAYTSLLVEALDAEVVLFLNVSLAERRMLEELHPDDEPDITELAKSELWRLKEKYLPDARSSVEVRFHESAAEGILAEAELAEPDMLVIASHGRSGMTRWMLGSVAERVARSSLVPVLIIPVRA